MPPPLQIFSTHSVTHKTMEKEDDCYTPVKSNEPEIKESIVERSFQVSKSLCLQTCLSPFFKPGFQTGFYYDNLSLVSGSMHNNSNFVSTLGRISTNKLIN